MEEGARRLVLRETLALCGGGAEVSACLQRREGIRLPAGALSRWHHMIPVVRKGVVAQVHWEGITFIDSSPISLLCLLPDKPACLEDSQYHGAVADSLV